MNKKAPVLTTNLITTATAVYQNSSGATDRSRFRRFRKTLLSISLVVTCTLVTIGQPHLTRLKVHRQLFLTVQIESEILSIGLIREKYSLA